jgi:hypothetical protein
VGVGVISVASSAEHMGMEPTGVYIVVLLSNPLQIEILLQHGD